MLGLRLDLQTFIVNDCLLVFVDSPSITNCIPERTVKRAVSVCTLHFLAS